MNGTITDVETGAACRVKNIHISDNIGGQADPIADYEFLLTGKERTGRLEYQVNGRPYSYEINLPVTNTVRPETVLFEFVPGQDVRF